MSQNSRIPIDLDKTTKNSFLSNSVVKMVSLMLNTNLFESMEVETGESSLEHLSERGLSKLQHTNM